MLKIFMWQSIDSLFFFPVQGNMGALGYNLCYTGWNGIFVGYEMWVDAFLAGVQLQWLSHMENKDTL